MNGNCGNKLANWLTFAQPLGFGSFETTHNDTEIIAGHPTGCCFFLRERPTKDIKIKTTNDLLLPVCCWRRHRKEPPGFHRLQRRQQQQQVLLLLFGRFLSVCLRAKCLYDFCSTKSICLRSVARTSLASRNEQADRQTNERTKKPQRVLSWHN